MLFLGYLGSGEGPLGHGHTFLTGVHGPSGSIERAYGVHKGHKYKVMKPFTPLLQLFMGPQVVLIDT